MNGQEIELPDLAIITGVNGAGKTHFLEALKELKFHISILEKEYREFNIAPDKNEPYNQQVEKIKKHGFIQKDFLQFKIKRNNLNNNDHLIKILNNIINMVRSNFISFFLEQTKEISKNIITPENFEQHYLNKCAPIIDIELFKKAVAHAKQVICSDNYFYSHGIDEKYIPALINIFKEKTQFFLFEEIDSIVSYVLSYETTFFETNLFDCFKNHKQKFNQFSSSLCAEGLPSNAREQLDEFNKNNPAPWQQINKIFLDNNLSLSINEQNKAETDVKPIIFKKNGVEIKNPESLSQGEQIICSILFSIFSTGDQSNDKSLPKILLLDEPDAHLHPKMSDMLIKFLHKISEELNIKVIITTHNPTTVAVAPESTIMQINSYENILESINKKDAIRILTQDIPNLLVDPENRKQIFCESDNEASLWRSLYEICKKYIPQSMELDFIGVGINLNENDNQYAGKQIVKKIVTEAKNSPNIIGLIDWDQQEHDTNGIIVHSYNQRYSIENMIFDPVFIIFTLLDLHKYQRKNQHIKDVIGERYLNDKNSILQNDIQIMINKLIEKIPNSTNDNEDLIINYQNGWSINIKKYYLYMNGHKLEREILNCFPELCSCIGNAGLKQHVIDNIIGQYCKDNDYIPNGLAKTFSKIISAEKEI